MERKRAQLATLEAEETLFRTYWRTLPDKALAWERWPYDVRNYCQTKQIGREMMVQLESRCRDLWEEELLKIVLGRSEVTETSSRERRRTMSTGDVLILLDDVDPQEREALDHWLDEHYGHDIRITDSWGNSLDVWVLVCNTCRPPEDRYEWMKVTSLEYWPRFAPDIRAFLHFELSRYHGLMKRR